MSVGKKIRLAEAAIDCAMDPSALFDLVDPKPPSKKLPPEALHEKIAGALERIDPEQASLLLKLYWERESAGEVADATGQDPAVVLAAEADALRALRGRVKAKPKPDPN